MILAGDIGGTNARLGLFEPVGPRPRRLAIQVFTTLDFPDLPSMIAAFLDAGSIDRATIDRASVGVAGPVVDDTATLTHVPWRVEGREVAKAFGLKRVRVLNDLVAMAYAIPVLEDSELHTLQRGEPIRGGNITLMAAGTGLGIALLHNVDGRLVGVPTAQTLRQQYHSTRDLLARYRLLREDHLRYLVKCGVIQPVVRTNADTFFAFGDVAIIKQANDDLAGQASFRAVARNLIASRHGQLAFDFRLDAAPAKILTLQRPADRPSARPRDAEGRRDTALAEEYFRMGSALDDGDESKLEQAAAAYR